MTGELKCDHRFTGKDMLCIKCGLYFPETNIEDEDKMEQSDVKCICCGKDSGNGICAGKPVCFDCYESGKLAELIGGKQVCEDKPMEQSDVREKLADLCHNQWSNWMIYLFSKCRNIINNGGEEVIPECYATRWRRQLATHYKNLSEEEKESDRKEADKFIKLLTAHFHKQVMDAVDGCYTIGGGSGIGDFYVDYYIIKSELKKKLREVFNAK